MGALEEFITSPWAMIVGVGIILLLVFHGAIQTALYGAPQPTPAPFNPYNNSSQIVVITPKPSSTPVPTPAPPATPTPMPPSLDDFSGGIKDYTSGYYLTGWGPHHGRVNGMLYYNPDDSYIWDDDYMDGGTNNYTSSYLWAVYG